MLAAETEVIKMRDVRRRNGQAISKTVFRHQKKSLALQERHAAYTTEHTAAQAVLRRLSAIGPSRMGRKMGDDGKSVLESFAGEWEAATGFTEEVWWRQKLGLTACEVFG